MQSDHILRIALTGGIGSGKSAAADYFESLGATVIDADALSHELTAPQQAALMLIEEQLGPGLVNAAGVLDRAQLRRLIFSDPARRKTLENILHPLIWQGMQERIERCTTPYCILVIPLLLESGRRDIAHRLLVIDAQQTLRMERVQKRDQQSAAEVRRIFTAQASRREQLAAADDVLNNNGTLQELQHGVRTLHQKYLKQAATSIHK